MGAYIVEIFDQPTNDFIVEMATKHAHHVIWLGGSDLVKSGEWIWSRSGVPVNQFDDWAPNQPDGSSDSTDTEDCMELNIDKYGGHWNDDQCEHRQRFICEKPADEEIIG
ncbi:C-type lectin [Plakobranchus ocellatus]|uniref:C-type lectin n=1 Tax=Plakobranchus ocellatus TaxID=259542 RepID=A0AAV3Z236_9GAST|nr:C-type lectin [Plakobranchus ocellatus]